MTVYGPETREASWMRAAVAREPLRSVIQTLDVRIPPGVAYYLTGGAVRGVLVKHMTGVDSPLRDLDFMGEFGRDLPTIMAGLDGEVRTIMLGGMRWQPSFCPLQVDIWSMPLSYSVVHYGVAPTLSDIMAGLPFNIERAVWNVREGSLIDRNCLDGIRRRLIIYDQQPHIMEHVQAARAVLMRQKTGFEFDESVYHLIQSGEWRARWPEAQAYLEENAMSPQDIICVYEALESASAVPSHATMYTSRPSDGSGA